VLSEIRFAMETCLDFRHLWAGRDAAWRGSGFSQLRVWDTEQNNGVLIYLLLADRHIRSCPIAALPGWWPGRGSRCARHGSQFRAGRFEPARSPYPPGVALIGRHFPDRPEIVTSCQRAGDPGLTQIPAGCVWVTLWSGRRS
jgi:hypothetical protein